MAYQPNIPLSGDQISKSQSDIKGNFAEINTFVGVDHVAFADPGAGMHKGIHLADGVPAPAIVAGQIGFYNSASNLYVKNGVAAAIPINGTLSRAVTTPKGWTYLPNGMILQWGDGIAPNSDPGVVENNTFAGAGGITFPAACLMVVACMKKDSPSTGYCWGVQTSRFTATGFQACSQTTSPAALNIGIYYFAIGY